LTEECGCTQKKSAAWLQRALKEEFAYVLLCLGEEEEALGVCEELLGRDGGNVAALKYKADALVSLDRAPGVMSN
jgi:hypothetical protein